MSSDNLSYFRARAVEERERASAAANFEIRAVHLDFAARYEHLTAELSSVEPLRQSRVAIRRSLGLLAATSQMVGND